MDNNLNEEDIVSNDIDSLLLNKKKRRNYIFIAIATVVAVIIIGALLLTQKNKGVEITPNTNDINSSYDQIRESSTSGADPEVLQNFLVEKIRKGDNDDETKSAVYWITHRYFDNGGNIYEIYDFINSHPETAFLKEAEAIYPSIFEKVKARTVTNYSRESLLALLAYYKTIDAHSYATLAIWGLAANKYSEQAYMNQPDPTDTVDIATKRAEYQTTMLSNARIFANKAEDYLINATMKTGDLSETLTEETDAEDLLVGLNQYASALAYLQGLGQSNVVIAFPFTDIFEFTSELAQNKAPRLYFFTNYLYATALIQSKTATSENVAIPLDRVIKYAEEYLKTNPINGSVARVINAKNTKEASVFSHENARTLASLYSPFKAWLVDKGWNESDF